jgi:hypothetical protein
MLMVVFREVGGGFGMRERERELFRRERLLKERDLETDPLLALQWLTNSLASFPLELLNFLISLELLNLIPACSHLLEKS